MSRKITQEEWDKRAAAANLRWLEPIKRGRDSVLSECLECGHQWRIRPEHVKQGKGCQPCSYKLRGENQLIDPKIWDERIAKVDAEWLDPVGRNSDKRRARCLKCGNEWMVAPEKIQMGRSCPECADSGKGKRLPPEVWDQRIAEIGAKWLEPFPGAGIPRKAECLAHGHQWMARPADVARKHMCPKCADIQRGLKRRVSQETWDERIAEVGAEWTEKVTLSNIPTSARCLSCEHEWKISPENVAQGRSCPMCNTGGFNFTAPSLIYLITKDLRIAKIGIMNSKTQRLRNHQRNGWAVEDTWFMPNGWEARRVELSIIDWWRTEEQFPPALPQGEPGWTETVDLGFCSVDEIKAMVRYTIDAYCPEVFEDDYWTEERLAEFDY